MKIAAVFGSNRKETGFSHLVARDISLICGDRATVDAIWLRDFRIELCDADNHCATSPCTINDDMPHLSQRVLDADAVIYVPVVHGYGTCSRMQAFIERLGYGFMRPLGRPMHDMLAMVVVVGRRYSHESVFSQMVLNLLLNRCILVGSGFPPTFRSDHGIPQRDSEAWESMKSGLNRMIALHESILVKEPEHT